MICQTFLWAARRWHHKECPAMRRRGVRPCSKNKSLNAHKSQCDRVSIEFFSSSCRAKVFFLCLRNFVVVRKF